MNDLIKIVERNIFLNVLEISDIEFQKKAWFGKYKNYISSYNELMCQLFDDDNYLLFVRQYAELLGYSLSFIKKLQTLGFELKNFNKSELFSDSEIINDPYWYKISKIARDVVCEWPCLAEIINETIPIDS